jgi:manganese-dependent inorganic pyrophosphatase
MVDTIHARPIFIFNGEDLLNSPIVAAASCNEYFKSHLEDENPDKALVIVGDRWDIQEFCIRRKVRALILSNGHTLGPGLADLAEESKVSVLVSPIDTSSTAMLIIYSAPVRVLRDDSAPPVSLNDPVQRIWDPISRAVSRCLAVGDEEGKVAGALFEGDLIRKPNIEIIMVDHNEPSQAIEGIEQYRILEVIDHHRLRNFSIRYPITFINKMAGSTRTIIASLYRLSEPVERERPC